MSIYTSVKKILLLTANPKDTTPLRLGEEVSKIVAGLQRSQHRAHFVLEQRWAVQPKDIQRAMLDINPQIIHFSGHGTKEQELVFEDETGQAKLVDAEALAGLFELFADQVECVVLNGCNSEFQAEAIARHIDYVVGMSQEIGDKAAIAFAVGFYDALGAGKSYEDAYKFGCAAVRLEGILEHLTPTLKKKQQTASFEESLVKPLAQPRNPREALDAYRQEVKELLRTNRGTISPLSRRILDALREKLGIQPQDANSIEYDAQRPYIERGQKLQEYVEALVETFQYENLLRDLTRNQLKRYQQILELNDEDIELIPGILGNVLYNQGKLDEALTAYREAIHINPEDEVIRQNLGNVLIIYGHIEEAVIEYKEAIRINPNNVQILTHLGSIFYNQDKFDEAISEYRKALDIEPNNAEYRVHLALILYTQDMLDEAIHEYREAIRIAPNSADAFAGLGRALCGRERFEEAVEMLEKAISIEPENAAFYRDLGSVLYKQVNLGKAIAMFKEAIKLDPHEAIAYTNLGAALYEQGQRNEAVETLEKASRFLREQNMIIEANRIDEALKQRFQGYQNWLSVAKKIFLW